MFGFGNREQTDVTEATMSFKKTGLMAFLKRRINPMAADREEKFARLEARVASHTATGEHLNQLGDMKLDKGLPDEALELYKQARDQFLEEDLIVKAIAVAKKILKQFPEDACTTEMYLCLGELNQRRGMVANAKEAYLVAAQRLQENGAIQDALKVFQQLAELLPDNIEFNADLARMYAKEGMSDEASLQFSVTAKRLMAMEDSKGAKELCVAALGQKSSNRDALKTLLEIALVEQDYREADAYMSRLGSHIESDWELLKAYGDLLAKQGRSEEAVVEYEKAVALNPMNEELDAVVRQLRAGGSAPSADGEPEFVGQSIDTGVAVVDLSDEEVGDFDPSDLVQEPDETPVPQPVIGEAASGDETVSEPTEDGLTVELEDYQAIFDEVSQDEELLGDGTVEIAVGDGGRGDGSAATDTDIDKALMEAKFYEEIGMADEAREAYIGLLANHPDHPELLDAAARLGLSAESSTEDGTPVVDRSPGDGCEQREVASGAVEVEIVEAVGEVESTTAPSEEVAQPHLMSDQEVSDLLAEADIYLSGTLFDEAVAIYERILNDQPCPLAEEGLATARSCATDEQLQQNEQAYEEGIEQRMRSMLSSLLDENEKVDEDPSMHLELACSYLEMGMADEALAECQIAAESGAAPPEVDLNMGRCYAMRGEAKEALSRYESFLVHVPDGDGAKEAHYELALLLLEQGEQQSARQHLETVLEIEPGFRDAGALLEGIAAK